MKQQFREIKLSKSNKARLVQINSIIEEYRAQGYVLTLRQLYYQLVSRDIIPNKQAEYAKLSNVLKEGRMGGIVDWAAIEDRLRTPKSPPSWNSPREIIDAVVNQYKRPRQEGQPNYIETWVEKDALSGVLSRVTSRYHVPILVNRGYSSVSAMYDSYKRFRDAILNGQKCTVLYLGDFDPSGVDMIRDIKTRIIEFLYNCNDIMHYWNRISYDLNENSKTSIYDLIYELYAEDESFTDENGLFDDLKAFCDYTFVINPIALTKTQIKLYNPPPNPAKLTDPRAKDFVALHGGTSWEVDALKPEVLNSLLIKNIESLLDMDIYNQVIEAEQADINKLRTLSKKL